MIMPSATITSDRVPVVTVATARVGSTPTHSIQITADIALVLREARPPKKFDNPMQPADANAKALEPNGTDTAAPTHRAHRAARLGESPALPRQHVLTLDTCQGWASASRGDTSSGYIVSLPN
jgi:hypothetical protein